MNDSLVKYLNMPKVVKSKKKTVSFSMLSHGMQFSRTTAIREHKQHYWVYIVLKAYTFIMS